MFDREAVRSIRAAIEAACESVGKAYGATITVGAGGYTTDNIRFKLEVAAVGKDGQAQTSEVQQFKLYAHMFGLNPEDLGRTFTYGGNQYKLVGLAPRRPKFPFLAENRAGKRYKFGQEIAKLLHPK